MPKTRSSTKHFLLGHPSSLPKNRFPLKGEVINYVKFLSENQGQACNKAPLKSVYHDVADEVSQMWIAEGVPIYDHKDVVKKIRAEYLAYRVSNKTISTKRSCKSNDRFSKLFDLARCKCASQQACCCPRDRKIPDAEWDFVQDQRGARTMVLGSLDVKTNAERHTRDLRRESRKRHEHSTETTESMPGPSDTQHVSSVAGRQYHGPQCIICVGTSVSSSDDSDEPGPERDTERDTEPGTETGPERDTEPAVTDRQDSEYEVSQNDSTDRNKEHLRWTAIAADRYGISNRAAAAVINAYQMDVGRVTSDHDGSIVAPMKIWRSRNQMRAELAKETAEMVTGTGLTSLYFDGRRDKTCESYTSPTETEEHVVVLSEPDSLYVSHFTPQTGSAYDMFQELHSINLMFGGDVKVLGCDGTAVNTGQNGGVCRLFELVVGKTVHWFVCQLHSNERNLRHVLHKLDGSTKGPRSYLGPIGSKCESDVWRLDVVQFEPVAGHVEQPPSEVLKTMSHDQQLLLELSVAVQTGSITGAAAEKRIGPLHHAR